MPTSIVGWLKAQGLGDAQRVEQWDTIEQELGHRCGLQNTLMDLSQLDSSVVKQIAEKMELHASRAARMIRAHESLHELTDAEMLQLAGIGELVGDSIKGQISEYCDLANLTDSDRRKANIPAEATHFVWAYQAEGVDSDDLSDEQKKLINQYSGEFAFASLGSFIYFKAGDVDEPPIVLGVNALGVGDDHRSGTIDRDPVSCHTHVLACHPVVECCRGMQKCGASAIARRCVAGRQRPNSDDREPGNVGWRWCANDVETQVQQLHLFVN